MLLSLLHFSIHADTLELVPKDLHLPLELVLEDLSVHADTLEPVPEDLHLPRAPLIFSALAQVLQ